jgi:hypothetical protein
LVRRGVTIGSVGALTALLSAESGAAVLPPTLVASTVGAATGTAAVSASVAALTKGALHMLFIAKLRTVSLTAAACLIVAGTGIVAASQLGVHSQSPAGPSQAGRGTQSSPSPISPVAGQQPPVAPADYKPVQLTRGQVVGMRNNAGRWSCQVALEKPFNNLNEITVACCNPPAIILLDGKPSTFAEAVAPRRMIEFDHVRGATPYISVSSDATKSSPLTWGDLLQKADAAAPGKFVDRKPTGATRDIRVNLDKAGHYVVSTINTLAVGGKSQETGRARVTLDAAGNLVGQVETDWKAETGRELTPPDPQ